MAAHQRLHARAGQRPVHHRRVDRRLALGHAQDLRLHLRDVSDARRARASTRPTRSIARADVAQPRRGAAAARERRLPVPGRSASRRSTAAAGRRSTLFTDTFETATGWTFTHQATTGRFESGDPAATNSSGAKQLGTTTSGPNDLVTGASAGAAAGRYDVDGGTTTALSPPITLTGGSTTRWPSTGTSPTAPTPPPPTTCGSAWSARRRRPSSSSSARPSTATAPGRAATASLNAFAGQTVRIRVEAADASVASLVEAAVDDLKVTRN